MYTYYPNNFEVLRTRSIANRRNQIASLLVTFLYCIYALVLLDNSTQDIYLQSQQYVNYQVVKSPKSVNEEIIILPIHEDNQNENKAEPSYEQNVTSAAIPPTHIQMCSHLQPRLEDAYKKYNAIAKAQELGIHKFGLSLESIPELHVRVPGEDEMDYILVQDDEHICEEPKSTVEALLEIYSSALLSEAATRFQLNVEYRHSGCHSHKVYGIQDMIRGDLSGGNNIGLRNSTLIDIAAIQTLCDDCLIEKKFSHEKNCILFTKPVSVQSEATTGFETIFPFMKENLRLVAEKWKNEDQSEMFKNYVVQFHPPPSLPTIPDNLSDDENSTSSIIPPVDPTTEPKASFVVYISCVEEDCSDTQDSIAVPFKFYTERINHKHDISSVSIIVSESCSTMVDGCLSYGQALYAMFINHFTKAQIELIQTPSTYHIYSQIFLADYIVCPPNHACILPAMLSDGLALVAIEDKKSVSQWSKKLISSTNTIFLTNFKRRSVTKLDHEFLMSK